MRWVRNGVLASLVVKFVVLGAWWWTGVARAERSAPTPAETGVAADLFNQSRGFRELLEAVRQRGDELDRREQALAARVAAVKALERTLGVEVLRADAGAAAASPGEVGGCGAGVTKIYQSMRPEEAARIIDRLDDGTVKRIFGCMKERQIGAILAAMSRDRAVAVTKALAGS